MRPASTRRLCIARATDEAAGMPAAADEKRELLAEVISKMDKLAADLADSSSSSSESSSSSSSESDSSMEEEEGGMKKKTMPVADMAEGGAEPCMDKDSSSSSSSSESESSSSSSEDESSGSESD